MMKILCVIPSRLASTRIPRKPLSLIQGKPMIQRVYEGAIQCPHLAKVVVATDTQEIADIITGLGGTVAMTDPDIKTGSDRAAVVAENYPDMDVIINLQGDQPFIKPEMLTDLVSPYLAGERPEMTTLGCPLHLAEEYNEPGVVKVIVDQLGNGIYFSRSPIPYFRSHHPTDLQHLPLFHHLGLYAFRRDFLKVYNNLPQTPLEQIESLEQLRVIEHGYRIRVCLTPHRILEINTQEELDRAQKIPLEA